jgi:hypothetical protein
MTGKTNLRRWPCKWKAAHNFDRASPISPPFLLTSGENVVNAVPLTELQQSSLSSQTSPLVSSLHNFTTLKCVRATNCCPM